MGTALAAEVMFLNSILCYSAPDEILLDYQNKLQADEISQIQERRIT
jgi:hypothetical protein